MLESGPSGSVRGVVSNHHPYRDPAPRAFFRPDRQIAQPPRAGPVKAGRAFAATRKGLDLIGPSTVAC